MYIDELTPVPDLGEFHARVVDAPSARRMRLYWLLIRPFSGLIRREMLHQSARRAQVDRAVAGIGEVAR